MTMDFINRSLDNIIPTFQTCKNSLSLQLLSEFETFLWLVGWWYQYTQAPLAPSVEARVAPCVDDWVKG